MASRALHLNSQHQKRSQTLLRITTTKLTFSHLFSSSSSSDNKENGGLSSCLSNIKSQLKHKSSERSDFPPEAQGSSTPNNGGNDYEKSYPFSSYLKDIQSKLKHHEEERQRTLKGFQHSAFNPQGSPKASSHDNIRQNLSAFRSRSTDHSPEFSPTQQPSLSQNAGNPNSRFIREQSFMAIKESMRQFNGERGKNLSKPTLLNRFRNSGITQETMPESGGFPKIVIGGSDKDLPIEVFGKEMKEKETRQGKGEYGAKKEVWMKYYSYDDLGKKLRELRPDVKGGEDNWVSELNDRLQKLKEMEQQELTAVSDTAMVHLRQSISFLQERKDNSKTAHIIEFDKLGSPSYMLSPPKEHLVEKYFHPDNMSAEDKMKLELEKVRDEFKMHESDCGSARVQIAQLTTEILHLSSVLHKKDKHSRRGLQAKVQQRKKLLKYLRRTDWESYCFVLSKLGLRDNPDYKN